MNQTIVDDAHHNNITLLFENNIITATDTFNEMLHKMCFFNESENYIYFDYKIFKMIASPMTYEAVSSHLIKTTWEVVSKYDKINIYACLKSISLKEIDKHKTFILKMISFCSDEFSDKLLKCYLYKTPTIFTQIYSIVSIAIDKETRQKVQIIKG